MDLTEYNLPDTYRLEQNLAWDSFGVNENYDVSYKRLHFHGFEYESDVFITYRQGEDLTVDLNRRRRVVLQINKEGHHAYPFLLPGDGYLFTIYNDDLGTAQLGTKPLRLVTATDDYLILRGNDVLAEGPFGLIDPGNTDYGVAVILDRKKIRKIVLYRYDTHKFYEYANTKNQRNDMPDLLLNDASSLDAYDSTNNSGQPDFDSIKERADSFSRIFETMSFSEKLKLTGESDSIFNIGASFWQKDDRQTALKYFNQAINVFPINTDVLGLYGDYYEYSDYELSVKFYALAVQYESTRKKDYYQLANYYKWRGQSELAEQCYHLWKIVSSKTGIED